jgi:O-antigen/teichoic acid export membrane protein
MSTQVTAARAALDVVIQVVGRLANLLLGLVVIVVLTRELGAGRFGQWSAIYAIVQLAGVLSDLGLEPATIRDAAAHPEHRERLVGALLRLRILLSIPATALAAAACALVAVDGDMALAGVIASLTVIATAPACLEVVYRLRVRNDVPIAVMTLNSIVWTAAVVVLAASHDAHISAFAGALLGAAVISSAVQAWVAVRGQPIDLHGPREDLRRIARVGIPIGIGSLLTLAYVRIDQVLVLEIAGEHDAGLYGAAYQLLDKAQFVPSAVMTTLFPRIAAAHFVDRERLTRLTRLASEHLAMVSFPVLAFAIAAAAPLVDLLYGAEFDDAARALPVLMGAFVTSSFGYLVGNLTIVAGTQVRFVWIAAVALVLNVIANVLLIPSYGFMAAAWVTLGTGAFVLAGTALITFGRLGLRPVAGTMPRTACAAALMALAVWAAREAGAGVGVLVVVAIAVYGAALLATGALRPSVLRSLRRGEL